MDNIRGIIPPNMPFRINFKYIYKDNELEDITISSPYIKRGKAAKEIYYERINQIRFTERNR